MIEYYNILRNIRENGHKTPSARTNMPPTLFMNSQHARLNFYNGFPILTGKEMPFYSIVGELIGFMKGITDVREFDKLGTKVWWDNAYKWNIQEPDVREVPSGNLVTKEDYKAGRMNDSCYQLGRIYPAQWRDWFGMTNTEHEGFVHTRVDQLVNIIGSIIQHPYSRYHVINAWNPAEMNSHTVSQPNCHVYFQASCVPMNESKEWIAHKLRAFLSDGTITELFAHGYNPDKYLMTHLTQRSCDMFLGVPFNLTSYSLFTILLAIFTNSFPIEFEWTGVNSHIYGDHYDAVDKYLDSELHERPKLILTGIHNLGDIEAINDKQGVKQHFALENYKHGPKIKANLSVGL